MKQELTIEMLIAKILNALIATIMMIIISMLVTYIAVLKGRLAKLMHENVGLMDKMNEGLMVLSKDELVPTFASLPAVRVLKQTSSIG